MFRRLVLSCIDLYRKGVSPLTPPSCRFVPTCSGYAREAVERFGVLRGGWLFIKRFIRCNPLGSCGFDPVPKELKGLPFVARFVTRGGPTDRTAEQAQTGS